MHYGGQSLKVREGETKMAEGGIHYLLYADAKARLVKNSAEYERISEELQEAIKMGDLRENSEYDAAKEAMRKVTKERDELTPVLSMPQLRSNDSASIFEEGCIIELKVYSATPEPMNTKSEEFARMVKECTPSFEGVLMFGGTLSVHELLRDSTLSTDTPIGKFLLGKQPGAYSIQVPGGFANVIAKKVKSTELEEKKIGCIYNG